ncbi:MAG: hypothetical protein AAB229_08850 [Candidatus Hydrogenedentota bacterium]
MSLKSFHIFFIALSSLLAFGFGAWCVLENSARYVPMGILSFCAGVALVVYGVYFLRKLRNVSFL